MWIKQIKTINIQNHAEVVVDLPEKGLVVFTGDNSNGKSVIVRTTRAILLGEITKPRKRASLVNRDAMFGEIIYLRGDDVKLTVRIAREAANTFVKYEEPGSEPIVRALADKNWRELVTRFGWHYDEDCNLTLNVAEEEDSLLFYKTSYKTNAHILMTANQDPTAETVHENFIELIKNSRQVRDVNNQKIQSLILARDGLEVYDTEALKVKRDKLIKYYNRLNGIYLPKIPEIKAVPKVRYSTIYEPKLPVIKYPRILDIHCNIPDILPIAREIKILCENKCPTCGRGFDCEC